MGVIFDNTETISFHINKIVKGAFYHLRNIAKIRKYINVNYKHWSWSSWARIHKF